jgi:hypothetical protein
MHLRRTRVDEVLFSPAALGLGRIHWMILRSVEAMDKNRFAEKRIEDGLRVTSGFAEFGEKVGLDEIHWWVFQKEQNRHELLETTKAVLPGAMSLEKNSAKLRKRNPESYKELLTSLRNFCDAHSSEINSLLDYVTLLQARDPRAPRILFTYRVWGSTRMTDRTVELPADDSPPEDFQKLLAEIVLGVRGAFRRKIDENYAEIAYEMYESLDPEHESDIHVPEGTLVERTASDVYNDCAVYFAEIRRSLRNIVLELEKFDEQRDLTESDAFWREFVTKAIQWKGAERQLWDFKETLSMWHIPDAAAREAGKVEFGEDVAAFANTTGGVFIVGVTDKTREIMGASASRSDLENRLKFATDVIARIVERGASITKLRHVLIEANGQSKVVVLVLVAQSRKAVGVDNGGGKYSYPVRRETGKTLVSREEAGASKHFLKSDNYDFLKSLATFVQEN